MSCQHIVKYAVGLPVSLGWLDERRQLSVNKGAVKALNIICQNNLSRQYGKVAAPYGRGCGKTRHELHTWERA